MDTVLAIDGNNIAHRSFHASGGKADSVLVGCISAVIKSIKQAAEYNIVPSHIVVAFDSDVNKRKEVYEGYKAQRSETDASLKEQIAAAPAQLRKLGIPAGTKEGFEADDVIASAVAAADSAIVVSSDRDLLQLISDNVRVFAPVNGGRLENRDDEYMEAKYGIDSGDYLSFAAMRGDKSDNLPGVTGIGEVKAAALVNAFGNLQYIMEAVKYEPAMVDKVAGKNAAQKLTDSLENLRRNWQLMTLVSSIPLKTEGNFN